jgi:8-amino-7-oxononanoate synthase
VDFDFATTDQSLGWTVKTLKKWYPRFMDFKVFELGLFTMIGDGLETVTPEMRLPCLDAVTDFMIEEGERNGSDFLLIRDVPLSRFTEYSEILRPKGFLPCSGFTNAVLYNKWETFDDFLATQNSKSRNKMRSALKIESKFDIEVSIVKDFSDLCNDMKRLWINVNAAFKDYSREQLTSRFFQETQNNLPQNSEVIAFKYNGKLIAFMYNLIGKNDYIMLDWGVDYEFKHYKQANLYRAASLLSVKRMIHLKKNRLEMGITNYVPKEFLGATLEPMVFFVRHKSDLEFTEGLARSLTDNISHAEVLTVPENYQTNTRPTWNESQWRDFLHQQIDGCTDDDLFTPTYRQYDQIIMRMGDIYGFYPEFKSGQKSSIHYQDNPNVVLLGTNSYLGLNTDPSLIEKAQEALTHYGTGCSGSPLLNGTLDLHNELERNLAAFVGKKSVILCSTGYQTNLAAISAIADRGSILLMDERNHRSLFDAARLSGAQVKIFAHQNLDQLERMLVRCQERPTMIVTDSVFSMEGSIADIPRLVALKNTYRSRLFVDESHAIGVLGKTGAGACEHFNCQAGVDLIMGTFSKSLAAQGGFVAGDKRVISYIKHNGAGHIFSASIPASIVATVLGALDIIKNEPERREWLHENAQYLASALKDIGFKVSSSTIPIIHMVLGHSTLALAAYKIMLERGVYVNPIIPPAIPEEEAGFRISLMASHARKDLDRALIQFERLYQDIYGS